MQYGHVQFDSWRASSSEPTLAIVYSGSSSTGKPTRSCAQRASGASVRGSDSARNRGWERGGRTSGLEMPVQTRTEAMPPRFAKRTSVSRRSPMKTVRFKSNWSLQVRAHKVSLDAPREKERKRRERERDALALDDVEQGLVRLADDDLFGCASRQGTVQDRGDGALARGVAARGEEEALVVVGEDEAAARVRAEVVVRLGELDVVDAHLERVHDDADRRVGHDCAEVLRLGQRVVLGRRAARPGQALVLELVLHGLLPDEVHAALGLVLNRGEDDGAHVLGRRAAAGEDLVEPNLDAEAGELRACRK